MNTVPYPLRIPNEVATVAKLRSEEQHIDKSTALRQLLHIGAEEYITQLVSDGRLSIGKASEMLGVSTYDIHRIAEKHGIRLGAAAEQLEKSRQNAKRM